MSRKAGLSRRDFLRGAAMTAIGVTVASCAQPTPQIVEKPVVQTVVVEKAIPVEKPVTVVVEKQVPVEKVVKETIVVEKQVVVEKVVERRYNEAPMLAAQVGAGKLPPVDERLPENPLVLPVIEQIGKYGGTWRRAYSGMSDRWGPTKIVEEYFWEYDPDLTIRPNVASKWELSSDASEWTIYLRRGMKWSDGEPFDTDDIAFFRDAVWKNKTLTPAPESDELFSIDGKPMEIEILDKWAFKLKFAKPYAMLGIRTWIWNYPEHYMKQYHPDYVSKEALDKEVKAAGVETWDQMWNHFCSSKKYGWWVNPDLPVIWPWKTTVPPPAEVIEMERNPYFWQVDAQGNQLPYIDRVTHRLFNDYSVLQMWVMNGEIDCQMRHMYFDYTTMKENEQRGDYRVLLWKQGSTLALNPNPTCPDKVLGELFGNVDFRHAMSVAIDREELNEMFGKGQYVPRQACPVKGSPQYDPSWTYKWIEYDPAKANELLDGLGLKWDAAHKFRLRPDGQPLRVTIESQSINVMHEMIARWFNDVGIDVALSQVERSLYEEHGQSGAIEIGTWSMDAALLPMMAPNNWLGFSLEMPWAGLWGLWKMTGGTQGQEPPANHPIREIWQAWDDTKASRSLKEATEKFKKIMDIHRDNIFNIGIMGEGPVMLIAKNNFRNVVGGYVQDDPTRDEHLLKDAQFFFSG